MNINDALRQARALLAVHGLADWSIVLDNAKGRVGQCRYSTKTISLSRAGILNRTPEATRNTILHEIAHAMTKGHHHDAVWARKFREIGGDGQRCSTESAKVPYRYIGTCPGCNRTTGRHKMSKSIKLGASCGQCSPRVFNASYRLVWVDAQGVRV